MCPKEPPSTLRLIPRSDSTRSSRTTTRRSIATACVESGRRMPRTQPQTSLPSHGDDSIDLPEGEATRAWLYGVAFRVVGNQYRSRQRRYRLSARLQSQDAGGFPADTATDHEVEVLYEAFDSLSGGDQELLRLSSWEGLTRAEIAQVLGIKENAVDQRLHRARSRLRAGMTHIDPSYAKSEETPT